MNKNFFSVGLFSMILFCIQACNFGQQPINVKQILENQIQYQDKEVLVQGEVGISNSVLGYSGFFLLDSDGQKIFIVGNDLPSPQERTKVLVKGVVKIPARVLSDAIIFINATSIEIAKPPTQI
jgi:hypothetical protein